MARNGENRKAGRNTGHRRLSSLLYGYIRQGLKGMPYRLRAVKQFMPLWRIPGWNRKLSRDRREYL